MSVVSFDSPSSRTPSPPVIARRPQYPAPSKRRPCIRSPSASCLTRSSSSSSLGRTTPVNVQAKAKISVLVDTTPSNEEPRMLSGDASPCRRRSAAAFGAFSQALSRSNSSGLQGGGYPQLARSSSAPGLTSVRQKDATDKVPTAGVRKHDSQPSLGLHTEVFRTSLAKKSDSARRNSASLEEGKKSSTDREQPRSPPARTISEEEDRFRKNLDAKLFKALNKLGVAEGGA